MAADSFVFAFIKAYFWMFFDVGGKDVFEARKKQLQRTAASPPSPVQTPSISSTCSTERERDYATNY